MFRPAFAFELQYRLRSWSTWVCWGVLILLVYREMLGGQWDNLIGSGRVSRNSPYMAYYLFMYYSFYTATIGGVLIIPTVLRDLQSRTATMLYSYPMQSKLYFLGKYAAMLLFLVFLLSSVFIGFATLPFVAVQLGIKSAAEFISTPWLHLVQAFLVWTLPGCFIYGTLLFAVTTLTGRSGPAYAAIMFLMGLFVVISVIFGDAAPNFPTMQVFDPLGKVTVEGQIFYWSADERMTRFLELSGNLLWNRALYVSLAAVVLGFALTRFDLRRLLQQTQRRGVSAERKSLSGSTPRAPPASTAQPDTKSLRLVPAGTRWDFAALSFRSGWREFALTVTDYPFGAAILGMLLLVTVAASGLAGWNPEADGTLLPVTFDMLKRTARIAAVFGVIGVAYFSAEIAACERTVRMASLVDASPVPTWSLLMGKLTGVLLVAALFAAVPACAVLFAQMLNGFVRPDLGDLLHTTLLVQLPDMLTYAVIAVICYGIAGNKLVAQAAAILICITPSILEEVKTAEHHLLLWGWPFQSYLSDFDASSQFVMRDAYFTLYWIALLGALVVVGYWFWPRGSETALGARSRQASQRIGVPSVLLALVLAITAGATGARIYRIVNVQNLYESREDEQFEQASYERRLGDHRALPQPKIIGAATNVELFPRERRVRMDARLQLANKSSEPITELHLERARFVNIASVSVGASRLNVRETDGQLRHDVYALPQALLPGQSVFLDISANAQYRGFSNSGYQGTLVRDGSYLPADFWPSFGYQRNREFTVPGDRRKLGLGQRKPLPPAAAAKDVRDLSTTDDSDYLASTLEVTTDADQIALAPGELVETSSTGGRRKFVYRMNQPNVWNPSIVSARYAIKTDTWHSPASGKSVALEVYFNPVHPYNVERFLSAAKFALTLATELSASDYPFESLRIAELPYRMTAESTSGNLIFLPEERGWVHDYREPPPVDWISYVVAREVARVWWGQQVGAANTRGAKLITEAIPALHGLIALERLHGARMADRYVKVLTDTYLRERVKEGGPEAAAIDVDDESYANGKTVLAMHSVHRLLGPARFRDVTRHFFAANNRREAPFGSAAELAEELMEAATGNKSRQEIQALLGSGSHREIAGES